MVFLWFSHVYPWLDPNFAWFPIEAAAAIGALLADAVGASADHCIGHDQ